MENNKLESRIISEENGMKIVNWAKLIELSDNSSLDNKTRIRLETQKDLYDRMLNFLKEKKILTCPTEGYALITESGFVGPTDSLGVLKYNFVNQEYAEEYAKIQYGNIDSNVTLVKVLKEKVN